MPSSRNIYNSSLTLVAGSSETGNGGMTSAYNPQLCISCKCTSSGVAMSIMCWDGAFFADVTPPLLVSELAAGSALLYLFLLIAIWMPFMDFMWFLCICNKLLHYIGTVLVFDTSAPSPSSGIVGLSNLPQWWTTPLIARGPQMDGWSWLPIEWKLRVIIPNACLAALAAGELVSVNLPSFRRRVPFFWWRKRYTAFLGVNGPFSLFMFIIFLCEFSPSRRLCTWFALDIFIYYSLDY